MKSLMTSLNGKGLPNANAFDYNDKGDGNTPALWWFIRD